MQYCKASDSREFFKILCVYEQPRGSTFPMLEGPNSQETEEDKECVITPSTSVKSNAALRERNHINVMKNYLLLIGITLVDKSEWKIRFFSSLTWFRANGGFKGTT